jgi:hypothetical protein
MRLLVAVVDLSDFPAGPVGVVDPAGEADRVVAVAGLDDQLHPTVIAVAGPLHNLAEDSGK